MRAFLSLGLSLLAVTGMLAMPPVSVAAQDAPAGQMVTIQDVRAGDGPCGFIVERTIEGTVAIVPSIDAGGNLVLAMEPITLRGMLTNPATGKSVELRWIRPNGVIGFGQDGGTTTVAWLLDGYFFRGYDNGRNDLTMTLPVDGADIVAFEPGQRSSDPWTHVCGLLA